MTDIYDKKTRSARMSKIKNKDSKPELFVRSHLHRAGFRFRLHKKALPGKPDLFLKKYNAAIFVNGCFWHRHPRCRKAKMPSDNKNFWRKKLSRNVVRDHNNQSYLSKQGYRVLIVWGCAVETIGARERNLPLVEKWLLSRSKFDQIPADLGN